MQPRQGGAARALSDCQTPRARSGQALEAQNAEYSMNDMDCESAIPASLHLVLSREEPTHKFNDVQIMSRISTISVL